MSQWTERVVSHSVWQQMETLGPALDQAAMREGIDPSTHDGLERIRAILTFAGKRLAGADPQLMHPAPLDGIAVASAPGAPGVRVWEIMSRGWGPRGGRPLPEGVQVDLLAGCHGEGAGRKLRNLWAWRRRGKPSAHRNRPAARATPDVPARYPTPVSGLV
jgi:hypothetical protein